MKRLKKLIAAAMVCTFALTGIGCSSKLVEKTPAAINKTVYAKIGDEVITKGDLDELMKPYIDQWKEQYGEDFEKNDSIKENIKSARQQFLNQYITKKVLMASAADYGVDVNDSSIDEEVQKQIDTVKSQAETNGQSFDDVLKQAGFETEDDAKKSLKESAIVNKVQQAIAASIEIPDSDAENYYNAVKDQQYHKKAGADAYHILISEKDADGNVDFDASLAKAKEVKEKLDGGADFAELAKEYGTDGTKDRGGSLGFVEFEQENYDADFLAGFKELKEGQISDPVKSQFGYHIIKAENINNSEHTQSFDEVKDEIVETLKYQQQNTVVNQKIEELKEKAGVKIVDKDMELPANSQAQQ